MNGLNHIKYLYDAAGTKLRKFASHERMIEHTTDYVGSFVYVDDELQCILTAEGRVVVDSSNYEYQYFLKDHLGNTRITFNESKQIIQEDSYYPFGMAMADLSHKSSVDLPNKFLYNGKELQDDFGLDWYDYGARFYDAQLGRFHTLDPLSENYSFQSPYVYAANSPVRYIDWMGMNMDEYDIERKTGKITKVNENKYYKSGDGEVKPLAKGESEEGKDMVDKITNSEGESEYFSAGGITESDQNNSNISIFENSGEGKRFYEFAAESSNVEWGAGEIQMMSGSSALFTGTDGNPGSTTFIDKLAAQYGDKLLWASHSHPGSGGPPSYDLRGNNNNMVGDLNAAQDRNLNTKYEVYDIPNQKIYFYNKSTLDEVRRGWQISSKRKR